jgi:hypothetical protein
VLLYSVKSKRPSITRCTTIFYVLLRSKQKSLSIKFWRNINCKAHLIFRDVKMWKNVP